MRSDDDEFLSVRTRRLVFGGFGWVFTAIALLRLSYGDVLMPVFFGFFAAAAFLVRWMSGKWWAELRLPPKWQGDESN
ncbi:MAG: hypothetical protein ACR2N2_03825 [Acidimicrobiia bacterium]